MKKIIIHALLDKIYTESAGLIGFRQEQRDLSACELVSSKTTTINKRKQRKLRSSLRKSRVSLSHFWSP